MKKKKNNKKTTTEYHTKEIPLWNQRNPLKPFNSIKTFDRNDLIKVDLATISIRILNHSDVNEDLPNDVNPERWLSSLIDILTNFKSQLLSTEKFVKFESIYLHAFVYQSGAFKKEKFLQCLKKVGKCLKRWVNLDLTCEVSAILKKFPVDFFFIQSMQLPSEHWLYDFLRKVVGGFYLMLQCINYCMEAAVYCRAQINGFRLLSFAFISYGIVSRIRSLGLDLLNFISATSDQLHPYVMGFLDVFPDPQLSSLPPNLKRELENFTTKNHDELRNPTPKRKKTPETTEDDKKQPSPNEEEPEEDGFIPLLANQDGDDVGEEISPEMYEKFKTPMANLDKRKKRKINE